MIRLIAIALIHVVVFWVNCQGAIGGVIFETRACVPYPAENVVVLHVAKEIQCGRIYTETLKRICTGVTPLK